MAVIEFEDVSLCLKQMRDDQNKIVYCFDESREIVERTLAEHIMLSNDETTSPRGVESRLHIRGNEGDGYEVWTWGCTGNKAEKFTFQNFETEEEADAWIYNRIYEYDFLADDQRDTSYFYEYEDAFDVYIERLADTLGVDIDVAKSWHKHRTKRDFLKDVLFEKRQLAEKVNTCKETLSNLTTSEVESLEQFFKEEKHPAPHDIYKLKVKSKTSWNNLRSLLKNKKL